MVFKLFANVMELLIDVVLRKTGFFGQLGYGIGKPISANKKYTASFIKAAEKAVDRTPQRFAFGGVVLNVQKVEELVCGQGAVGPALLCVVVVIFVYPASFSAIIIVLKCSKFLVSITIFK